MNTGKMYSTSTQLLDDYESTGKAGRGRIEVQRMFWNKQIIVRTALK